MIIVGDVRSDDGDDDDDDDDDDEDDSRNHSNTDPAKTNGNEHYDAQAVSVNMKMFIRSDKYKRCSSTVISMMRKMQLVVRISLHRQSQ